VRLSRRPIDRFVPLLVLLGALAPGGSQARAADAQWWITDSAADHARSEARGVAVEADGSLSLGPRAESSPAESLQVVWSVQPLADGSVALAGDRGRIDRWTEKDGVRPWIKLPVGQVLSLAYADGELVAGCAPEGLVYRIGAKGDTSLLARTGERYVWALAPAAKGAWWAATGTHGRLMKIAGGKSEIVLDSDESNLVCLVSDGAGGVFAGGDSHGRVFHARGGGGIRTVLDAAEDEVRALAIGPDGALYAAGLSAPSTADDDDERPQPVKSPSSSGRAIVYRVVPDSASWTVWSAPQPYVFALLGRTDGVLAATGNRAAVYRLGRSGGAALLLAMPQGQVTALAADGAGRVFAATSNPGALWRLGPGTDAKGELISGVFDARRIARFGAMRWRGDAGGGKIELHSRSGNTDTPDTTWSTWEGGAAGPDGRRASSPAARYFQWKIVLSGGKPRVESVDAAWREVNQPPRIEDLAVAPQGYGFREGELTPRVESITQTLPGGQKVEYTMPSPVGPRALRELPMWARGLRTVQWRGSDPNGDPLEYRVDVRLEGAEAWIEVGKDLDGTSFTWDTNGLPEGRYRLRVTATDAPGNAVGEERKSEALSEPFTVDNTPPVIGALEARAVSGGIEVSGKAEDGFSPLSRLEASLDDDDWRAVSPESGIADERSLTFHFRLPDVAAGEHTVSVRAVDLAGNATLRASRVSVPRGR
jgi:hypothetical protein